MSHFDAIVEAAAGFRLHRRPPPTRRSRRIEERGAGIYGVQFHPEVAHTPRGQAVLKRFLSMPAGAAPPGP